ncbi:unnamed protein product [Hymenolepis diminuta]|uniref:Integrase catalytic domain-containing protein n=1 Tax=Hymenolepis diminuta TaxID=6216 RepID=A0A564Y223_HYMDI|nr:unnamed protein product [Hymenolepis diminuta]
MRDLAVETVARNFTERWIATFGVPTTITAESGTQFESQLFSELTHLLGTNWIRTTAYHPQTNGLIEGFPRQLKAAPAAHSVKEDLNCSASEMAFGVPLKLSGQFLFPSDKSSWPNPINYAERLRFHMLNLQTLPSRPTSNPIFTPTDLNTCSHVFLPHDAVRKPLQ